MALMSVDDDMLGTQGVKRRNDYATAKMTAENTEKVANNTDQLEALQQETINAINGLNTSLTSVLAKLDTIIANQNNTGA